MPIYQYKCNDCDHCMEALQKISDEPLTVCPQCEAASLRKQLTAAAFKLKGTGWYETDFKNSGNKPEAKSSKESSADKGSKVDATTNETAGTAS